MHVLNGPLFHEGFPDSPQSQLVSGWDISHHFLSYFVQIFIPEYFPHVEKCIKYAYTLTNNFKANTHLTTTQVKTENRISPWNPQRAFLSSLQLAVVLLFGHYFALFYTFAIHIGILKPQGLRLPVFQSSVHRIIPHTFPWGVGFPGPGLCLRRSSALGCETAARSRSWRYSILPHGIMFVFGLR